MKKKRKDPESILDELMPVDDLPGMSLYFDVLRLVAYLIGELVDSDIAAIHAVVPSYHRTAFYCGTFMMAVAPVSAVAALWFVPRLIAIALRKARRPGYYEQEKARRQALAHERRSTRRRTTLNPIPTPEALLVQFGRIRRNPREMLVFGSMLEDLEAYVDNSLVRDPDGTIVGRNGGIKQWLRENCAELGKRYHTVMRYKALAKRFKQAIDLEDPVPVAYAIAAAETPIEVVAGDPDGGRTTEGTEMQLRCGQKSDGSDGQASKGGEGKASNSVQLWCGPNSDVANRRGAVKDGECVVEAVTPERFELLRGSADVADGYRRMIRFMIACNDAKAFLAGCQATKTNLDERLARLLEPDLIPTSPHTAPGRGKRVQEHSYTTSAFA
jgi:hypothetical protein